MNQDQITTNSHFSNQKITYSKYLPWFIWALGALFFFCEYFARVSTSVMVNDLMSAFRVNAANLGSLSAFFYVTYIMMQLPVGILVDRYGPHRLLVINALLCGLGCGLFAIASQIWMADIGRLLMGFGASFAFVGTLKLASIWFPAKRFGLLAGLTQALGMLGAAVGEAPMAMTVAYLGWRYTMHTCMFIFFVLAILIALIVRDAPHKLAKKSRRARKINRDDQSISLLENIKIIAKNKQNWLNALYVGLLYAPSAAFAELWGVNYLSHVQHIDKTIAATSIGFIFIGWTFGGPFAGWLSDRICRRKPIMIISAILSFIFITSVLYIPHLSTQSIMILLFCYGFCNTGVVMAYAVSVEINPRRIAGTAAALANMASVIVGACFQPIIGMLLDAGWQGQYSQGNIRLFSVQDYHHAMLILPICLLLTFLLSFFIKETFCQAKL